MLELDPSNLISTDDFENPLIPDEYKPARLIPSTDLEEWYIWHTAIKHRIIGQTSPSVTSGEGARKPVIYDFIAPDTAAIDMLNGICETLGLEPRSKKVWVRWLKNYANNTPPNPPLDTFKTYKRKLPKTGG